MRVSTDFQQLVPIRLASYDWLNARPSSVNRPVTVGTPTSSLSKETWPSRRQSRRFDPPIHRCRRAYTPGRSRTTPVDDNGNGIESCWKSERPHECPRFEHHKGVLFNVIPIAQSMLVISVCRNSTHGCGSSVWTALTGYMRS